MWSRRFETPLALRPPERMVLLALGLIAWMPAAVVLVAASVPAWASVCAAGWLAASIAVELRRWSGQPVRALWRPRTGWSLEWPGGVWRPARLTSSCRVFPGWMALSWSVEGGSRARLLLFRRGNDAASHRRLRVLLRNGRSDG